MLKNLVVSSIIVVSTLLIIAQTGEKPKLPQINDVPQEPVASKESSDLEDEGIKGKVRIIQYETESLTRSEANKGRQIARVDEFNLSGNKYTTSWFRDGGMYLRNYFGYLDGFRVCKSYGNAGPGSQLDKIAYEYKGGKIVKETTFTGNGLVVIQTYAHSDGEKDSRQYGNDGKLEQRLVFKYDAAGNETGFEMYDIANDINKISFRFTFTYEAFDRAGNWTQRTSQYFRNGSERSVPAEREYRTITYYTTYNPIWFTPVNDPNKPDWEILPQEAKPGEVILSKRNELGILSNFAATPFELDGKRYASVEGFWQMMLYPESPNDDRARDKRVEWKYTRDQVAQMTAFEAKAAGTLAEENMTKLGIDWCTYQGKKFPYRSQTPGEHYRLILAAMRAKLDQNPEVKRVLLATGDLKLRPDHIEEPNAPPEWHYYELWMQIRPELQKQ